MASDRVFGLVLILLALAYIAGAYQIQTSFLADPVGSKTFPILIAVITALCGLIILLKPDEEPEWPDLLTFGRLGLSVLVLVIYAYAIRPYGFIGPTAVAAGILAWQITPHAGRAALTGIGLSVGLFVLFKYGLGLGLVPFPHGLSG